jgi:hypothetical protein
MTPTIERLLTIALGLGCGIAAVTVLKGTDFSTVALTIAGALLGKELPSSNERRLTQAPPPPPPDAP